MTYIEHKLCECRNCKHKQYVSYTNGNRPLSDRACATCNECGFKSVWCGVDWDKLFTEVQTPDNPKVDG